MKLFTTLFSVFFLTFLLSVTSTFGQEVKQISPIRAKLMARNGTMMIDVRERDEVKEVAYDVDGIVNIPLSEIEARMNEIPKDVDVILACRSGNRSAQAASILAKNGYTKLYNMEGGMLAWQEKKLGVIIEGKKAPKKACCANPNSKNCNPDGTCKKGAKGCAKGKKCCSKGAKGCSKSKAAAAPAK